MNPIFLSAGPRTASKSFRKQLELYFNSSSWCLKDGGGIGHLNLNPYHQASKFTYHRLKIGLLKQRLLNKQIIFYQHLFPTDNNLRKLERLINIKETKFIISCRNIFDIAKSFQKAFLYPKINNVNTKSVFFDFKSYKYTGVRQYFSPTFHKFNIFDILLVLNFYALWINIEKKNILDVLFVDFDEITNKTVIVDQKLSNFLNKKIILNHTISKIDDSKPKNIQSNEYDIKINDEINDLIINYAKQFNDVNFEIIGL